MSNDADFMDEHNAEEAKAAEKQSQIDEHGLKYDGSKIGYQPWANSPGIYCVKPEVYYTCNKDEVKIGFSGGESTRGKLGQRMASYATAFVDFRILFVITYSGHDTASMAEKVVKNFLKEQGKSARVHASGSNSEWYEVGEELIGPLLEHMYDVGTDGYLPEIEMFDPGMRPGTMVWARYQNIFYPAKIQALREKRHKVAAAAEKGDTSEIPIDVWEKYVEPEGEQGGSMKLVKFFDAGSAYGIVDTDDIVPWQDGIDHGYASIVEVLHDVVRAEKYISNVEKGNSTRHEKGVTKPEPAKGWWYNKRANMTMRVNAARFMLDEHYPFVPKDDRPWRNLKNNLEKAERGGDPREIRIAKAELRKYVAGRTKTVLDEYYEEPPAPSSGPSSASVGGMFGMDDAFDSVISVEEPIHPAHISSGPISSGPIPRFSFVPPADAAEQLDGELAKEASKRQKASAGGAKKTRGSRFSAPIPLNRSNPLNPFGIFRRLVSFF